MNLRRPMLMPCVQFEQGSNVPARRLDGRHGMYTEPLRTNFWEHPYFALHQYVSV